MKFLLNLQGVDLSIRRHESRERSKLRDMEKYETSELC